MIKKILRRIYIFVLFNLSMVWFLVTEIKKERRTLKNQNHAKRESEEKALEELNDKLRREIWQKNNEIKQVKRETEQLIARYQDLDYEHKILQRSKYYEIIIPICFVLILYWLSFFFF